MNKITVFYHYWIPDDIRALFWYWWLDEQLSVVKQSKLDVIADVNMHVCMPAFWGTDPRGIEFTSNSDGVTPILFQDKLMEYVNHRYPNVHIHINDLTPDHVFEGHTLVPLWEYSLNNPGETVVYIHNKGVCSSSPQVKLWRETLNKEMIEKWPQRIKDLEGYDVLGVKDATVRYDERGLTHTSGNFFWATTDYIATLEKPLYTDRYEYERWITSNTPNVNYVLDTYTDHFTYFYGD